MADNQPTTYTAAQLEKMLADAEAKGEAKARSEAEAMASQERAKEAMTRYALYLMQRHRIISNRSRNCRSCTAWHHTHVEEFGY